MTKPTLESLDNFVTPNVAPCYCSVVLQRAREVTIEGWLIQTDSANYLMIQPSVMYESGMTKLAIAIDEIISITPTFPPEPYHGQVVLSDEDVTAGFGSQRFETMDPKINKEAFMRL